LGGLFVFSLILSEVKKRFSQRKNFVIPAKAGTQSFVYSNITNGLGPGLRRGDEIVEQSKECQYPRAVPAKNAPNAAPVLAFKN
jgi:hypothetical protein